MAKLHGVNGRNIVADDTLRVGNVRYPSVAGNPGEVLVWNGTELTFSAGGGSNPEQYGAVGDGVADDTVPLQAAIDDAVHSVNLSGTYLHGFLRLRSDITYYGGGTLIAMSGLTTNSMTSIYYGENADNLTNNQFPATYPATTFQNVIFSDLTFNTQDEDYWMMSLFNCKNICFDKCKFNYGKNQESAIFGPNYGYALRFVGSYDPLVPGLSRPYGPGPQYYDMPNAIAYSENIVIRNCSFVGSDCEFVACRDVEVHGCDALDTWIPYRADFLNTDIKFVNNSTRVERVDWQTTTGNFNRMGVYVGQINQRVIVANNTMKNHSNFGVVVEGSRNVIISHNTISNSTTTNVMRGVYVYSAAVFDAVAPDSVGSSHVIVSENTIDGAQEGVFVGVFDLTNQTTINESYDNFGTRCISIVGNVISSPSAATFPQGIAMANTTDSVIAGNKLTDVWGGVNVNSCARLQVSDNYCVMKTGAASAIFVTGSPYVPANPAYPFLTDIAVVNNHTVHAPGDSGGQHLFLGARPTIDGTFIDGERVTLTPGRTTMANLCAFSGSADGNYVKTVHFEIETVDDTATTLSLNTEFSYANASAGVVNVNLPAGFHVGQIKRVLHISGTFAAVVTPLPSLFGGGATLTLSLGQSVTLMWLGSNWGLISRIMTNDYYVGTQIVNTPGVVALPTQTSLVQLDTTTGNIIGEITNAGLDGQTLTITKISGLNEAQIQGNPPNLIFAASAGGIKLNAIGDTLTLKSTGTNWVVTSETEKKNRNTTLEGLVASGPVSLDHDITYIDSTAGVLAMTLADGVDGQRKTIVHSSGANAVTLTPTNLHGFSTVTTNAAGEAYELVFGLGAWAIVALGTGVVVA